MLTRKVPTPPTPGHLLLYFETVLERLWRSYPSSALYRHAVSLHLTSRISFYDALIVAAALEAGCDTLYTEDLNHGQSYGSVRVCNPFIQDFLA